MYPQYLHFGRARKLLEDRVGQERGGEEGIY